MPSFLPSAQSSAPHSIQTTFLATARCCTKVFSKISYARKKVEEIVYLSYLLRGRILDLQQGKDWSEPLLPMPEPGGEVEIISGYELQSW